MSRKGVSECTVWWMGSEDTVYSGSTVSVYSVSVQCTVYKFIVQCISAQYYILMFIIELCAFSLSLFTYNIFRIMKAYYWSVVTTILYVCC